MVFEDFVLLQKVLASLLVGYLLGSVPFAHLAARIKGIDIFSTGNRRAGTANVFWNVSRRTGVLVFAADVSKGSLAVIIASLLDLQGTLVILAGGAAILGHWNSIFTGFKGGDGMATLIGITIVLTPKLAVLGILVGILAVALTWKTPYRSACGIAVCFLLVFTLSLYNNQPLDLSFGLVALAVLVVAHNIVIRHRLSLSSEPPVDDLDDLELDLNLGNEDNSESDLRPPAPRNR